MAYLKIGGLSKLQGVPVENRSDELVESINNVHHTPSNSSSLKRFLKISNRPLMIARQSATSFYEDNEELDYANTCPNIFSRRKAPESYADRTLSFITYRDQSSSNKNRTPQGWPLPTAEPTTHKLSKSFYWNRLFHRQKGQSKVEAPEQETLAGKEAKEVLVLKLRQEPYNPEPENQSAENCEEPPCGASQEQQPIDPKPEHIEPTETDRPPLASESEVYRWKRWFRREKRQPKDKTSEEVLVQAQINLESTSDFVEPSVGASQEQQPIGPKPELLEPMKTDRLPVVTESKVYRWKRWFNRKKKQSKDEAPEQETLAEKEAKEVLVLKLRQEPYNPEPENQSAENQSAENCEEPPCGASHEQQPINPKPELLEPMETDRPPVATESEVYRWKWWLNSHKKQPTDEACEEVLVQKQSNLESANDFEEQSLGAGQEQQPINPKPELLEPMETDRPPVATESEVYRWKWWLNSHKKQPTDEDSEEVLVRKQSNAESTSDLEEPSHSASQEQQLPSDPKPERLKPKTPIKRFHLPVATESEVYWKRWFHRRKSQVKVEAPELKTGDEIEEVLVLKLHQDQNDLEAITESTTDFEEPSPGASQEQPLPSDLEPHRLKPKTPMNSDNISVTAELENAKAHQPASDEVNLPMDRKPERSKPNPQEKRFARNVSEDQILNSFEREPEEAEPNQPASDELKLPVDPEPELWKTNTPEQRFARNLSNETILSTFKRDHLPGAAPNQLASEATEPEDVESHHSGSDEVNLPNDPEPERSRPNQQEMGLARNVSEGQFLSTFKSDHLSVATEPEKVETHESALDMAEQEDAEPNQPASDEVNLPIEPEPQR